ncbi:hypothetical protein HHL28_15595 [Aerophototrophica crusticola]|uniref:Uncharacterized protein n=1 Tax=Aerophototrophica crusticola TaxID=1709002 RepID=A0A858R9I9_9PROT|nr:hypothetical protein HHL28_15595 [Rhodospirillaceae bacterium B3]
MRDVPGRPYRDGHGAPVLLCSPDGGRAYELSGKGVQGSPVAFKVVSSIPRGGETVVNIP